jgi:hypothetical protein
MTARPGGVAPALAGAAIAFAASAAAPPAARAQPEKKDSVVHLRQDLEALRGQIAYVQGRDSQHDSNLADLARRISEVEQRALALETREQGGSHPEELAAVRAELYQQLAVMQGQLDGYLDEPVPSQVDHEGGFVWTSEDEAYQLRIGGHLQSRWSVVRGDGAGAPPDDSGFALRRARVSLDGTGAEKVGFRVMAELAEPELVEGWLEYNSGNLSVRAGRDRVPFLRSGVMPEALYGFAERSIASTALGRDRDLGVALRFHPPRSPVQAVAMIANGDATADPDDVPLLALRTTVTPIGEKPDPGQGNLRDTRLSVTVGLSFVVDPMRAPAEITAVDGTPMMLDADSDGDGITDRLVAFTSGLDLTFRVGDFELAAEGVLRYQGLGDLLVRNPGLAEATGLDPEMTTVDMLLGGAVDATWIVDRRYMLGARYAYSELPFLAPTGTSAIPQGKSANELDLMLGFYRNEHRLFGLTYRFVNHGVRWGGGGDGPTEHAVIAEAQVVL